MPVAGTKTKGGRPRPLSALESRRTVFDREKHLHGRPDFHRPGSQNPAKSFPR